MRLPEVKLPKASQQDFSKRKACMSVVHGMWVISVIFGGGQVVRSPEIVK